MEHLLFANSTAPITFSFLGCEDWDGGDFLSYPQRQGWDTSIWEWSEDEVRLDTHGRKLDDFAAFLQSWLFFGLLMTVLGRKIPCEELTRLMNKDEEDPRRFITTSKLAAYLDEFGLRYTKMSDEEKLEREDIIWDALSEARIVTYRLNRKIYLADSYPDSDVLQETLLCQTLLYLALARFIAKVITSVDWKVLEGSRMQPWLEKRMTEAGWCPFDVRFLCQTFDPDITAFIFSLGCTSTLKDHRLCDERYSEFGDRCVADSVGMRSLPKHVEPQCDCPLIGPDMNDIETAVRNRTVPVIALSLPQDEREDVDFVLWEENLNDDQRGIGTYFAISHVWNEGLGNPDANLLPKCQVMRMANLLLELENSEQGKFIIIEGSEHLERRLTVPFWIDTFCIPVSPQSQDLRNICIARMRKIYESATAVIVLDPDLQRLSSDANPTEFLGHLMSCSWRGRLWTYQEGNLAWDLLVPAHGKCFDLAKILDLYPEYPESELDVTDGTATGYIESSITQSMADACRRLIRSTGASSEVAQNPEIALASMLRALAHRTTSRDGDEAICIATFMNIDPVPILAESSPKNRMRKLLSCLRVLSKAMLFTYGPRLQEPGFRWAPETFLAPHGYRKDINFPVYYRPSDRSGAETTSELVAIPASYFCPKGRGMVAVFSAIKLDLPASPQPLPEHFIVLTSLAEQKGYVIDMNDAGEHSYSWSEVCEDSSTEWAVLFANEKKLRHTPDALLVKWLGETEDGQIRCEWKYDVLVEELDDCILEGARKEKIQQAGNYRGHWIPFCEWIID